MASQRVRDVGEVLERQARSWKRLQNRIEKLHKAVIGAVRDDDLKRQSKDSLVAMAIAAKCFENAAHAPEVTIATTGTTSSGKSTLANLLLGVELLPKSVQEMSAGVVRVHHSDIDRLLIVEETRGASWATGQWKEIGAADVRRRLEDTMAAYRRMLGDNGTVASDTIEPPRFVIHWRTRLGENPEALGLPSGTKLTIVDLPGLKFVNDDINGPVVRDQVRKALCVVAYNSFETDPRKQAALLREVVDQVKALRGSPARMLFVLNRIDAFLKDRDPKASEREFADRVTRQIRLRLREALPEFTEHVETIEPVALSSEPALYASLAEFESGENAISLIRKLKREYNGLFPEEQLERLPGSPLDWSDDQRRWFLEEAKYKSRFEQFETKLRDHITKNLPELLLPELVENADKAARDALVVVDAIILAYGKTERANVNRAKDRLESVNRSLKRLKSEAVKVLDPIREVANGDSDLMVKLFVAVPEVERRLGVSSENATGTGPLAALCTALPDAVQEPLQRLNDIVVRLMAGESVDDTLLYGLPCTPRLNAVIDTLRTGPYGQWWRTGGEFDGTDAPVVEEAVKALASSLAETAQAVVARESVIQADRMKGAIDKCGEMIVQRLEREAAEHAAEFQGLRGVFRGTFDLAPPRLPPMQFSPDIERWKRIEERVEEEKYWTKERTFWHWFWIVPKKVQKTRNVIKKTERSGIVVAKLGDLLEGFATSGSRTTLETVFAGWLVDGVIAFDQALKARLKSGVKTYRSILLKRMSELEEGAESRISTVEAHLDSIRVIADDIKVASDWRHHHDG